jgi:hypothetical protein
VNIDLEISIVKDVMYHFDTSFSLISIVLHQNETIYYDTNLYCIKMKQADKIYTPELIGQGTRLIDITPYYITS